MSGMMKYLSRHYDDLLEALLEHLELVVVTLVFSLRIAAVLTVAAVYSSRAGEYLIQAFSVL